MDFVLKGRGGVTVLEVASARRKDALPGLAAFAEGFRPRRRLLIGGQGVPLEEFFRTRPEKWAA